MRKKSHISLAKGIIHGLDMDTRIKHRLSFYIGSIWPDLTPSFLVRKHNINDTFHIFQRKMESFISKYRLDKDMGIMTTLRMGVITHYIADYFTFPHNSHYDGNLKDHCVYEEELKHRMYSYIDNIKENTCKYQVKYMESLKQVEEYIKDKHRNYMSIKGNTADDCGYSFEACINVVASLMAIAVVEKEALALAV